MANQEVVQVMSLPLPPTQYINIFTEENVRRSRILRPPPCIFESYSMFGIQYNNEDMIRSLESQGIKRLIPQHFDRRKELKKKPKENRKETIPKAFPPRSAREEFIEIGFHLKQ